MPVAKPEERPVTTAVVSPEEPPPLSAHDLVWLRPIYQRDIETFLRSPLRSDSYLSLLPAGLREQLCLYTTCLNLHGLAGYSASFQDPPPQAYSDYHIGISFSREMPIFSSSQVPKRPAPNDRRECVNACLFVRFQSALPHQVWQNLHYTGWCVATDPIAQTITLDMHSMYVCRLYLSFS